MDTEESEICPVAMQTDKDLVFVEQPPRNTAKATLPQGCVLKRTNGDRSNLFVPSADTYEEMRCSSSITQHVQRASRFHGMSKLNGRSMHDYTSTDLCCWHDGHAFEGNVYPIPKSFDCREGCFIVWGCFCSLSCAKAFVLERSGFDVPTQLVLLERMAREIYGIENIEPSPPRLTLDIYGGPYSLSRFRTLSKTCTSSIISAPFISTYMVVEERDLSTSQISALGINGISTVRGMRRPAQPISLTSNEIPAHSPYVEFLKDKGVSNEEASGSALQPAKTKASKQRASKGTLARFMQE